MKMFGRPVRALSFLHRTTFPRARSYHGHFSTTDGRLWKRKLHGTEDFSAFLANDGEGYAHISFGVSTILKPSISSETLRNSVRNAWIRLRYYAPLIALRTQNGEADDFFMSYESSKTSDVAVKWAGDTLKWEEQEKTLDVRDLDLKERWWGTDGSHNMEMHIGPGTGGRLHFMLLAAHWAIDGHLSLPLVDKFLEFLVAEVEGKAQQVDELKWGDETKRLPPALIEAVAEPYRAEPRPMETGQSAAPLPRLFVRPVELVSQTSTSPQYSTLSFSIALNKADTAAFHKECKRRKCNVTPVVNAILVLADVETALWWSRRRGQEKFNAVKEMFENADLFPIPINGMDRRLAFVPEHYNLESPLGTPGVASEGYPTKHDMNLIRKGIIVSEDGHIQRDMSDKTFWNGVVADAIAVLEPGRAIPPTFLSDQVRFSGAALRAITDEVISSRILCSSIGDMDKLGVLGRWRPSTATADTTLVIDRMILSIRVATPTIACICYQYDGILTLHLQGSSKHNSKEAWHHFGEAVQSRVRHIVNAGHGIA